MAPILENGRQSLPKRNLRWPYAKYFCHHLFYICAKVYHKNAQFMHISAGILIIILSKKTLSDIIH